MIWKNVRFQIIAAQVVTAKFLATFKDFPPRQRAPSFGVDQAVEKLKQSFSKD